MPLQANAGQLRLSAVIWGRFAPPSHPNADAGYIIMEQVEYPVMSDGNTISVVTVLLEMGMPPMKEPCGGSRCA